jgi:hypothetical protein
VFQAPYVPIPAGAQPLNLRDDVFSTTTIRNTFVFTPTFC